MSDEYSCWKSPAGRAAYMAAYDAVLGLWPVRYESVHVPTGFGSTHVIISGPQDAPPLVLLHGGYASSTKWLPNIADLSRAHRTYAVDTVGEPGKSVPGPLLRSRSDSAQWLVDVLDALKLGRPSFIGSSRGGWLAMNLALLAPERVDRIVLLSPGGALVPLSLQFYLSGPLAVIFPAPPLIRWSHRSWMARGHRMPATYERQFVLGMQHYGPPKGGVMRGVFGDDELRRLAAPTLILIGDQDCVNGPRSLERARRLIPGVEVDTIHDAGHMLGMEQPQAVDARILAFLGQKAGGAR